MFFKTFPCVDLPKHLQVWTASEGRPSAALLCWRCVISQAVRAACCAAARSRTCANAPAWPAIWSAGSGSGCWSSWKRSLLPASPCLDYQLVLQCDYQLEIRSVTLSFGKAQEGGEELACSGGLGGAWWWVGQTSAPCGLWHSLAEAVCSRLSLSFMSLQAAHGLQEFLDVRSKAGFQQLVLRALSLLVNRCLWYRQGEWSKAWKRPISKWCRQSFLFLPGQLITFLKSFHI